MSTFKEHLDADMDIFFNDSEFAEPITYNGTEILCVPADGYEMSTSIPGVNVPTRSVLVKQADVASPKAGDKVVMDTQTWYVSPGMTIDGGLWSLTLTKEIRRIGV